MKLTSYDYKSQRVENTQSSGVMHSRSGVGALIRIVHLGTCNVQNRLAWDRLYTVIESSRCVQLLQPARRSVCKNMVFFPSPPCPRLLPFCLPFPLWFHPYIQLRDFGSAVSYPVGSGGVLCQTL